MQFAVLAGWVVVVMYNVIFVSNPPEVDLSCDFDNDNINNNHK